MLEAAIVVSLATLVTLQRWYVVRHRTPSHEAGFWKHLQGSIRLGDDNRPLKLQRRILQWVGYWLAVAVVMYVVFVLANR